MKNIHLTKLMLKGSEASDKKCYIYVRSEWLEDSVKLMLQDTRSHCFYSGQVKQSELKEAADELEIPLANFRSECEALFSANIGLSGFEVELDEEEKMLRINKIDQFTMQYLEVKLDEVEKNYELLDTALKLIEDNNQDSQKDTESLQEIKTSLSQCIKAKEELKETMLKKFNRLLLTKKEKIAKLKEELDQYHGRFVSNNTDTSGDETSEDNTTARNSPQKVNKRKQISGDGGNEESACYKSSTQQIEASQHVSDEEISLRKKRPKQTQISSSEED